MSDTKDDDVVVGAEGKDRLASFNRYRNLLFSVAYRMLGSVTDAEDMLQETFIRWQQSADDEIRSARAYLITIISRLCINHLQSARVQREEYVGQWLPEPIVTSLGSDPLGMVEIDESLSMAFLMLLERLTPVERAVFLLREVFDYRYSEIASVLRESEANCRQILHRAKQQVNAVRPRFKASQQKQSDLLKRFLAATSSGDLGGLIALLASDVELRADGGGKATAVPNVIRGTDKVARGVLGSMKRLVPKDLELRLAQVNGEAGLVTYLNGKPFSVLTLDVVEEQVRTIYVVTNPEKLSHVPSLTAD